MKKAILIFLVFLFFESAFALELISLNEKIDAGETYASFFEAKLKSSLKKDDLKVYEERREVYFEKGIYSYENKTFIYVIFPKEGNFTIEIKSFLYYENETLKEGKINKTISVGKNSSKVLQISPGIILGESLNFSIANKGKETLNVKFQNYSYTLKENESKVVFANPEKEFFYLNVESYKNFKIPVFYFSLKEENRSVNNTGESINKTNEVNKTINETKKEKIKLNETKIEKYFEVNKTDIVHFYIENLLNEEINISLKCDLKNLNFSESEILLPFEQKPIFLYYHPNETGNFEKNLTISFEDIELNLTLKFYVVSSESIEIMRNLSSEREINSCEEIKGILCTQTGYTCKNGNNLPITGVGFCCVGGECVKIEEEKTKKSFSSYVIGIVFLIIAGAIGYFVYKKYKSVKK